MSTDIEKLADELANNIIEQAIGIDKSQSNYAENFAKLASAIREMCGEPIIPNADEALAYSLASPKTAALAFDRVYRVPVMSDSAPPEIGFYGATDLEIRMWAGAMAWSSAKRAGAQIPTKKFVLSVLPPELIRSKEQLGHKTPKNFEDEFEFSSWLLTDLTQRFKKSPTIIAASEKSARAAFPVGNQAVLTAAISNVALVDEATLSWDQILEFRKDSEARKKYRRLVRWVDLELASKSPKEVEDLLSMRLEDYSWSLKKHGLEAKMGAISCLLDPKFLTTTSAAVAAGSVAGGALWGILGGAALMVGKSALTFGTALIDNEDKRRKENYEVAYTHEVKDKFGS